ncbi:dihydroneopterin aldolase [Acidihalobacter yilgarnensis]|uniref:7,8-dihydroneopterin aldolase n=1 Tax=Acidihalobacter yilgarnensis TaxID=2819280 RepID=A0A1D8IKM1_9GAMM|nr:dihydroneopterin aldolase [Acidihalobacter yilgarnensis]AOU97006.1 dihydroneopterin aldolase [Acidihalobacter yilgarnensis]
MDRIFIQGLKVAAVIGVHEWERRITQTLCVDLSFAADVRRAAASDALEDTVDYAAVAARLRALGEEAAFGLVETFAERCAERVMTEFDVSWVRVGVTKDVALPGRTEVGVVIERGVPPESAP